MALKTYVLLDRLNTDAPVYQRVNKEQRVRLNKIPVWQPYLQQTFQNKDGVNTTIRYKSNSNTIFQSEQIEKEKIPANERYTTIEREDLKFYNGVKVTGKVMAQKYLETYPGCDGFEGVCDDIPFPEFKLLNPEEDIKSTNTEFKKRTQAAVKIVGLNLKQAQDLLIRLNGAWFKTSESLDECQNLLVDYLDSADESGVDALLKEDVTIDEKNSILIGKLLNANMLSFDAIEGKIVKKKKDGKRWIEVKDMPASALPHEKIRLFSEYLNSNEGSLLKDDLEKDAATI